MFKGGTNSGDSFRMQDQVQVKESKRGWSLGLQLIRSTRYSSTHGAIHKQLLMFSPGPRVHFRERRRQSYAQALYHGIPTALQHGVLSLVAHLPCICQAQMLISVSKRAGLDP